ncbi:MAG TPA: YdbL family protein [Gammaproteobacteria bacterium]|nr:YdbL family protein [Gammaproteobacteria bacterium]
MKMRLILGVLACVLAACVTVNVYFPTSAAERAADIIVREVYDAGEQAQTPTSLHLPAWRGGLVAMLDWLVPAAAAQQPDINISTPAIAALRKAMEARHAQLRPHYASGAIGMQADGLIVLRDPKPVPLEARNLVKKLVADENADRNRLYAEVAQANAHPEWEPDIRRIFAASWVQNAPAGWWYQNGSTWSQK